MRVLDVFLHPKKTTRHYLEHPDLSVALILVLLPTLVFAALAALLGFRLSMQAAVRAGLGVVFWVVSGAVLYLVIYLLKGKSVQGKFMGLLNAIALTRAFSAVLILLMAFFGFVMAPGLFSEFRKLQDASPTVQDVLQAVEKTPLQTGFLAMGFEAFLLLAMAALVLESLYIWYAAIAAAGPGSALKNLAVFLLVMAITSIAAAFLR